MPYESIEALESFDSESEAAEARTVRKPPSQPSFRPRPAPNAPQYVTQTQLETSLARSDAKINVLSAGVSTINSRINSLSTSLKKEAEERKKSGEGQNKDLNQKLQLLTLLPLLIQQPSVTLNQPNTLGPGGSNLNAVSVPDSSQLDALLPLLLISGVGGTGGLGFGGGGDSSSGSDGSLMLLALVLAFAKK
jgi:outer membrane murein-binding lipoprotein Lpp